MNLVAGNELQQLPFRSQRRFCIYGQADAGGDPEDMGIDGHIGLVIDDRGDDVGGFAADAGQSHQFFNSQGYLAAEISTSIWAMPIRCLVLLLG